MNHKANCLSHWFPILQAAGVPVPRTEIVRCREGTDLTTSFADGDAPNGWTDFIADLGAAVDRIGCPCFLRTGQGSGKHQWKDTCCLTERSLLATHVGTLVEWSECAGMLGLPCDVWCVREMLPVDPVAILDAYGDMPLVPELRVFVKGGSVVCRHWYWPAGAICKGFRREPENIGEIITDSRPSLTFGAGNGPGTIAVFVALALDKAFPGSAWSVDLLLTKRGWYATDCALAGESFHWPGCDKAKEFSRKETDL